MGWSAVRQTGEVRVAKIVMVQGAEDRRIKRPSDARDRKREERGWQSWGGRKEGQRSRRAAERADRGTKRLTSPRRRVPDADRAGR